MSKKVNGAESLSLFAPEQNRELVVVHARFVNEQNQSIADLFQGFEAMKALTYSASLPLIRKLLPWFQSMEIIFGLEEVLSNGIQDVLAYQQAAMEGLREVLDGAPPDIGGRLAQGSLQFMVMHSKVSHKKTFLLSGSGRVPRVIVGSANLSVPGLGGIQEENLIVFDDEAAYAYYLNDLEAMKKYGDLVPPEILTATGVIRPEELPLPQRVVNTRELVILEKVEEPTLEQRSRQQFSVRFSAAQAVYRDLPITPDRKGNTVLQAENMREGLKTLTARRAVEDTTRAEVTLTVSIPDQKVC